MWQHKPGLMLCMFCWYVKIIFGSLSRFQVMFFWSVATVTSSWTCNQRLTKLQRHFCQLFSNCLAAAVNFIGTWLICTSVTLTESALGDFRRKHKEVNGMLFMCTLSHLLFQTSESSICKGCTWVRCSRRVKNGFILLDYHCPIFINDLSKLPKHFSSTESCLTMHWHMSPPDKTASICIHRLCTWGQPLTCMFRETGLPQLCKNIYHAIFVMLFTASFNALRLRYED